MFKFFTRKSTPSKVRVCVRVSKAVDERCRGRVPHYPRASRRPTALQPSTRWHTG